MNPNPSSRRSRRLFTLASWLALISLLAVVCLVIAGFSGRMLLLLAIVFSATVPMALRSMRGRLDILEPLVLANVAFAIMFIGRPLADLATGVTHHYGYSVLATFDEALVVALIGVAGFQAGYVSPFGRFFARRLPRPPAFRPGRAEIAAWMFFFLGVLLFGAFLTKHGGMGLLFTLLQGRAPSDNDLFMSSTGYLYNGILLLGASALIFFALATLAHRRHHYLLFSLLLLPLLVFYGARGTRIQLLPLAVAIPVFWYLSTDRRPRLRTLVLTVCLGISVIGWLRDIRTVGERGNVVEKLAAAVASPLDQFTDILMGPDAEMFDSLANELLVIPERLPFHYGASISDTVVRAVPRPLWPSKPLESNDALVNALWPDHFALSRAAPAFSIVGVFYADSGVVSVALGMFLGGALTAALWGWYCRHRRLVIAQLVYSMALPFVVILLRGTIPDTLARALFLLFPLTLLYAITRVRAGRSAPRSFPETAASGHG